MDLKKIEKLMELMRTYGVHEVEVDENGERVKLSHALNTGGQQLPSYAGPTMGGMPMAYSTQMYPPPAAATGPTLSSGPVISNSGDKAKAAPRAGGKPVKSPFVGTFYRSPSPGSDAFVSVGQRVKKGDVLCIIEAMKLMNEIEAEFDGTVVEILADNGDPVEYDQTLFVLE